jgi:hypothetical protein
MDFKDGWIKKIDFQWIRRQLFSKPLCVDDIGIPRFKWISRMDG